MTILTSSPENLLVLATAVTHFFVPTAYYSPFSASPDPSPLPYPLVSQNHVPGGQNSAESLQHRSCPAAISFLQD